MIQQQLGLLAGPLSATDDVHSLAVLNETDPEVEASYLSKVGIRPLSVGGPPALVLV